MLATSFNRNSLKRQVHSSSPIGENELRRIAPSVFADAAHESRSARYSYIPTIDVLRGLEREGFRPFFAVQATTRTADRQNHTKHMLRLRHADHLARSAKDVNEVIIINSHDGASKYQMMGGVFQFVCANGLVCGDISDDIRIKHSGDVRAEVINGALGIVKSFARIDESKEAFRTLQLSDGERMAYASAALAVRYPTVIDADGETVVKAPPIDASDLLTPRRYEDRDRSLWTTFNVVQENAVQGGVRTNDRRRRSHTRAVNGIDGNVHLNRALWVLAEEMRKMKTA